MHCFRSHHWHFAISRTNPVWLSWNEYFLFNHFIPTATLFYHELIIDCKMFLRSLFSIFHVDVMPPIGARMVPISVSITLSHMSAKCSESCSDVLVHPCIQLSYFSLTIYQTTEKCRRYHFYSLWYDPNRFWSMIINILTHILFSFFFSRTIYYYLQHLIIAHRDQGCL